MNRLDANQYIPATGSDDRAKIRTLPWALSSSALNCFFALWTLSGSVFVLFLNELGLPKDRIGVILSLFPFCGLLALGSSPGPALGSHPCVALSSGQAKNKDTRSLVGAQVSPDTRTDATG